MTEPTPAYFEALAATQELHATSNKFNGRFFLRYAADVHHIIKRLGCKTLLDYGCGKGWQWRDPVEDGGPLLDQVLGVQVTKYDPGWPEFAAEPTGTFDIVVCTQVLGSIPIADLPWAVERLYGFATKAVYVGERIGPVRKKVHAHMVDQMPHGWSHAQWAAALRRPGASVEAWLRSLDGENELEKLL